MTANAGSVEGVAEFGGLERRRRQARGDLPLAGAFKADKVAEGC